MKNSTTKKTTDLFLGYLQDVCALNDRIGEQTLLVVRKDKKSTLLSTNIAHVIPSVKLNFEAADELIKNTQKSYNQVGNMTFEKKRFNDSNYFVVHAIGPRKIRDNILPRQFLVDLSGVEKILRYKTNFPFSKVFLHENKEIIFSKQKSTLDELVEDTVIAFDAEWHWQKGNEIYSSCIFDGKVIHATTTLNFNGELELNTDFREEPYKIIVEKVKDGIDLVRKTTHKIQEIDPGVICIQNSMSDLDKFRELSAEFNKEELKKLKKVEEVLNYRRTKTSSIFRPGVDSSPPRKITGEFFEKREITGREIFDSVGIAFYFLSLPNNQLHTISNYLLGTDLEKESYDTLEDLAVEARNDQKKAVEVIKGNALDTIIPYKIYKKLEKILRRAEFLFETGLSSICLNSDNTLSGNLWDNKYYKRTNTLRPIKFVEKEALKNLDIEEEKFKLFSTENYKLLKNTKGFYNAHVIYLTPFIQGFLSVIKSDKNAWDMYTDMRKNKDPNEKIIMAQLLNIFLREPYFYYKDFINKANNKLEERINSAFEYPNLGIYDWIYGKNYSIDFSEEHEGETKSANIKTINNHLLDAALEIHHKLKNFEVINHGRRYLYIKDEEDKDIFSIIKYLEEKGLAIYLGRANVLSVSKQRIASKINNSLITEGLSIDKNIADRTPFEKAVIFEFVKLVLDEKKKEALEFIDRSAKILEKCSVPREALEISGKARLDWFNYMVITDRIKYLINKLIIKGQDYSYLYGEGKLHELQKKFFGVSDVKNIGYNNGSISEVVSAAYPNADRKILRRIFLGKSNPGDISSIVYPAEQLRIF